MTFSWQSLLGLVVLLGVGLFIALIAMTWYTVHILTHPPRRTYASALARGRAGEPGELDPGPRGKRPFTSWVFQYRGLDLPVWDISGDNPEGPVFILSHGWGDSRIGGLTRAPALAPHASRLILWDMPGHGDARGSCALGTREVEALCTLIDRISEPVVLFGWSLGAGVSIAAAARGSEVNGEPVQSPGQANAASLIRAVIAEAPYRLPWTPARNVLASFGLPYRVNLPLAMGVLGVRFGLGARWRGFDRSKLAAAVRVPLLVIHGTQDAICPVEDGREIATAAPDGRIFELAETGHHSIWTDPPIAARAGESVRVFLSFMHQST